MNKRAKACDISKAVKIRVWERDGHRCIFCGSYVNVMPNAHYIPRSKGGLGIEENIITACTAFGNNCHYIFDEGAKQQREAMRDHAKNYLKSIYPDWDESKLIYSSTIK